MRFRKKPVEIDATCYRPGEPLPEGVEMDGEAAVIKTLEGVMTVSPGDWVITGVQGERYPCKPDIFVATYDPVEEPKS